MIELSKGGAYLLNGTEIIEDGSNAAAELSSKARKRSILLRKKQQRIQLPMVF